MANTRAPLTITARFRSYTCMDPATQVLVNDLDITRFLRGIRIDAHVGALTEVSLDLIGVALDTQLIDVSPPPIQFLLPFPEYGDA